MEEAFRPVAIVTAAGSAERFGGAKLLAPIRGEPLLDHAIRSLLEGGVSEVIVVVGTDGRAALERDVNAMNDARVRPVENRDPARGMFSSIQEGARTANGDALVVLPGDMPYVRAQTVRLLLDRFWLEPAILSPRYRGKRGHPVVMPMSLRDEITGAPVEWTLHEVLKRHPDERVDVDVDDAGIVRDVDRPEDLGARS